jgi:hypothetical protein
MKIAICITAMAALVSTCTNTGTNYVAISNQIIEYQGEGKQYAVVVVEDEGVTTAEAKKFARQRAAEMTVEKGGRYFKVISEEQTQVIKSDRPFPDNQAFYQNMYQELIIEGDFNKERLQRRSVPSESLYNAYRMVFEISDTKSGWKSVDACTLTECNK